MFSTPMHSSSPVNGAGATMVDGNGTINPAALASSASTFQGNSHLHAQSNQRSRKRSRSPADNDDVTQGGEAEDDVKAKKRGRQYRTKPGDEDSAAAPPSGNSPEQLRTPVSQTSVLPQDTRTSPTKVSPPKTGGTRGVLKALPTVRDHTTDQLTDSLDEYIPREFDEAGERKVAPTGHPQEGREFKIRTFYVPARGEKLFMLATECARVLNYRDSYLLFNKNRSLYKIIATQAEKDELIHQEILPYSYRSRQIAIVTAKSMFRQFGARIVQDGRRVRDDYWEAKARKQGFTEDDAAGEKRPGTTKAKEAAEAANAHIQIITGPSVAYDEFPLPQPASMAMPIPMIQTEIRDFSSVPRHRQDITGPPFTDHMLPSSQPSADLMHQASNAAENSKNINQQRASRHKLYEESWNRPHDSPAPTPLQKIESSPTISQSPHVQTNTMTPGTPNAVLHQKSHMMSPSYQRQPSHNPSPIRQPMPPTQLPPTVMHHPSQNRSAYNPPQTSPYAYQTQPGQMWGQPPPQPQPNHPHQSPISPHHQNLPQYSPSPNPQQPPQLQHHPSQSPHPQQPPQLHTGQNAGNMHGNMNYQSMAGMPRGGPPPAAYNSMGPGRSMYNPNPGQQPGGPQGSPHQQHDYMAAFTAGQQQGGAQGWAGSSHAGQPWGGGYPVSSGY